MLSHLYLDLVSALFLTLSPWIFGFSRVVDIPHLIAGRRRDHSQERAID